MSVRPRSIGRLYVTSIHLPPEYCAFPSLSGAPHVPPTIVDACPAGESGLRSCAVAAKVAARSKETPSIQVFRVIVPPSSVGRELRGRGREGYRIRPPMRQYARALVLVALIASQALPLSALPGDDRLAYALTGGRVIVAPGKVIDSGVVVIRGGIIEAVGAGA